MEGFRMTRRRLLAITPVRRLQRQPHGHA
jgi:hypothetical protein